VPIIKNCYEYYSGLTGIPENYILAFYFGFTYILTSMNSPLDEKHLLKRIANDDREAFDELYSIYMFNVYSFVHLLCKSKETTEEIVQDLFVKIWINRGKLEHITYFKAYIFRAAQNLLLDRIRRLQIEVKGAERLKLTSPDDNVPSDSTIICRQFKQITMEAINHLPAKRKHIVVLRTQDELSLDEIAEQLKISKTVVKKQLYAGLIFIRDYIHKLNDGYA